jgi:hypothetical protein
VGTEVVGQFFDNKVGHVRVHLLGDRYMRSKPLISIKKSTFFDYEVTDSGYGFPGLCAITTGMRVGWGYRRLG